MTNKELCERYPFLIPWKVREGRISIYDWKYERTLLDDMEPGWRKAFGIQMCEELRAALIAADALDRYWVGDIKEKWGELRWYSWGGTLTTADIEEDYLLLSRKICGKCGKPATHRGTAWVYPYCSECATPDAEEMRR